MKANFSSESEVIAVPQPEFTDTWKPFSHKAVIDVVANTLEEKGIGVIDKTYSLTQNGKNVFPPGPWIKVPLDAIGC